ncbi:putative signal transducing protein [Tenacibaculum holothuriorum]|nr:DUF2007 domain-containing protein [Tenacibaculum holothuriorum]
MKEHIKIFTGTSILVNRLAYLLDQINIPSIIKDDRESGRLAGFGTFGDSSELHIFNTDLEQATNVIENFQKEIKK